MSSYAIIKRKSTGYVTVLNILADNEEDKGHGYHIASLPLDEISCIVMQLEMTKQKLMENYGLMPSPDPVGKNCGFMPNHLNPKLTDCRSMSGCHPNPAAVKKNVKPRNRRMEKFNLRDRKLIEEKLFPGTELPFFS